MGWDRLEPLVGLGPAVSLQPRGVPRPCGGLVHYQTPSCGLIKGGRAVRPLGEAGQRQLAEEGRVSGGVQGRHGDDGEQGRDPVQQGFDGTRGGQVQENPVLVLFDLRGHFEQGQDDGPGLGRGEGRVG